MTEPDRRPPIWVGHVMVAANDIGESARFYVAIGMRLVEQNARVAILELRGGTHLVIVPGEPADDASFDLMVEDLDVIHNQWTSAGLSPTTIERGRIHDTFDITDPAGTTITVSNTHVVGVV